MKWALCCGLGVELLLFSWRICLHWLSNHFHHWIMFIWTWLEENILLFTSRSSTMVQINSSSAVALAPICKITLLCCLQLPGTPLHLPGAGGDESWWIFTLAHIFTGKANYTLQEPLGSGRPMMWEVTVYKRNDFLLALWSVTVFPLFPLFLQ